jgi:hypothetical protein
MGTTITDWAQATGAMYMGANTSWELIWTAVAVALCIVAMISGSKHELDAYKKLKDKQ